MFQPCKLIKDTQDRWLRCRRITPSRSFRFFEKAAQIKSQIVRLCRRKVAWQAKIRAHRSPVHLDEREVAFRHGFEDRWLPERRREIRYDVRVIALNLTIIFSALFVNSRIEKGLLSNDRIVTLTHDRKDFFLSVWIRQEVPQRSHISWKFCFVEIWRGSNELGVGCNLQARSVAPNWVL